MNEIEIHRTHQQGIIQADVFSEPREKTIFDLLRQYLPAIWKRRWLVLGVLVSTFTVSLIMAFRAVAVYTATGTVAIEPARQQVIVGVEGFTPGEQGSYEGRIIQMHLDILQSRMLAERVIEKLRMKDEKAFAMPPVTTPEAAEKVRTRTINGFLRQLAVEIPKGDVGQRVIRVNYNSTDPRLAAEVLNTLFETFIEYNRESNANAVEFARDWLTKQLAEVEAKLEKSKEALLKYQQSTDLIYQGDTEQNPAVGQLTSLNQQLAEAKATLINNRITYQINREGGAAAMWGAVNDPGLNGLKDERAKLNAQLTQMRAIYTDQSPPIKQLEQQLADLDSQIQVAEQTVLDRIRRDTRAAEQRVQALEQELERQRAEILIQNQDALQFSLLRREAEVDEKLFQMLSERLKEAELMRNLAPKSNIQVIDRAEIPLVPSNSNRLTLLFGAVIGLALGIGMAVLMEFLDDSIKTTDDVEAHLKLPSLGVIPLAGGQSERLQLSANKQPQGSTSIILVSGGGGNPLFSEAYRTLRTSVLLSSAMRPPRTIVITGNEARAGKTTTAVNAAIALAQAGKRVLLIDADMRHPGCALALGVENAAGLSTYLSTEDRPAAIYHDCSVPGLDLLPSGPIPPNPSELLSTQRIYTLLESMADRYDHVVIDTPPLGLVSDALILAALVDGVILVVKAEETSRRGILRAKEALRTTNARILGVVLNAVDLRRQQNGYYEYGYGYYPQNGDSQGSKSEEEEN